MANILTVHPLQYNKSIYKQFNYIKPHTWDFNDKILARVKEIDNGFRSGKITGQPVQWLFSDEVEFCFKDKSNKEVSPEAPAEQLQKYRDAAKKKLRKQLNGGRGHDSKINAQMSAIDDFNVQDLILFDIHEELGDIIEFRFGKEELGIGYYDAPGHGEIRLKPVPAEQFLINYNTVIKKIHEVSARYTNIAPSIYMNHINFSPNYVAGDKLVNLIMRYPKEKASADFLERAFAGILKVFHDSELTVDTRLDKYVFNDLGNNRGNIFRTTKNRVEYRMGTGEKDHMADLVLKILGGAAYGASHTKEELLEAEVIIPQTVKGGVFCDKTETADEHYNDYTKRVLESSILQADGTLFLPYLWLMLREDVIEEEIFGKALPSDKEESDGKIQLLQAVFKRIKVFPDGRIDLTKLREWKSPPAELLQLTDSKPKETRLQRVIRHLKNIRLEHVYETIASEGYHETFSSAEWATYLTAFHTSPANQAAYGESLMHDLTIMLTRKVFLETIALVGNRKTNSEDASIKREIIKVRYFLKHIPAEWREDALAELVGATQDIFRMNALAIHSCDELMKKEPDNYNYWKEFKAKREKNAKTYLPRLAQAVESIQINAVALPKH